PEPSIAGDWTEADRHGPPRPHDAERQTGGITPTRQRPGPARRGPASPRPGATVPRPPGGAWTAGARAVPRRPAGAGPSAAPPAVPAGPHPAAGGAARGWLRAGAACGTGQPDPRAAVPADCCPGPASPGRLRSAPAGVAATDLR